MIVFVVFIQCLLLERAARPDELLQIHAKLSSTIPELKHASGISCRQYILYALLDLFHLSIKDLHRKIILSDVVKSRAFRNIDRRLDLNELNSRESLLIISGVSIRILLTVQQVTGVIIADASLQRSL